MSVETTPKLMTADELLALPHGYDKRYELVKGELITMSPAGFSHGIVCDRIASHLSRYVAEHKLGVTPSADTGYLVARDPDTVLQPDTSFVVAERVVRTKKYFPGAPDLAVEVISPTDRYTAVQAKVREYLRAGTRMVVVVDIDEQVVTVSTPTGTTELSIDDLITATDVVPGWSLPVRDIFAD